MQSINEFYSEAVQPEWCRIGMYGSKSYTALQHVLQALEGTCVNPLDSFVLQMLTSLV